MIEFIKHCIKEVRRWYYFTFPTYEITETKICTWQEADKLIREADNKGLNEQWHVAARDASLGFPMVAIERRKRIIE